MNLIYGVLLLYWNNFFSQIAQMFMDSKIIINKIDSMILLHLMNKSIMITQKSAQSAKSASDYFLIKRLFYKLLATLFIPSKILVVLKLISNPNFLFESFR